MPGEPSNRPDQYRSLKDVSIDGVTIKGLRRRPDGRFYAAAQPTKTFGKKPKQAAVKFLLWKDGVLQGEIPSRDFEFWRDAFAHLVSRHPDVGKVVLDPAFWFWRNAFQWLIFEQPQLANQVLGVRGLENIEVIHTGSDAQILFAMRKLGKEPTDPLTLFPDSTIDEPEVEDADEPEVDDVEEPKVDERTESERESFDDMMDRVFGGDPPPRPPGF